jgi:hypothetical protein
MQLIDTRKPRIAMTLCLMTANLLSATGATAQNKIDKNENPPLTDSAAITNSYDEPVDELGTTTVDSAVLYYKEDGGRVTAIEPMVSIVHTAKNGNVWSAKLTYDTLSGASPNGAAPWSASQTFTVPLREADSTTGASGTAVLNPLTGKYERRYTTPANTLPVDNAFRDNRGAVDLGFSTSIAADTRVNMGFNGSVEKDYTSISGRLGLAQELNNKATTLSLGVNFEHDQSKPFHGIPVGLSLMSGLPGATKSDAKNVLSVVAGVTQIIRPNWLVQLNYSFGSGKGYQTDPYKFVSVVDPVTGAPQRYLYEARPDSRTRHSIYLGSKLAVGSWVTDVSARYYHDSWGIDSITAEIAEHVPLGSKAYLEPRVRYYHQSAADFFHYFLPSTAALPNYASADSRLDSFNALTFGGTAGYQLTPHIELYANAEAYRASKAGGFGTVPAGLASQKLFAGANSISGLVGLRFKF